MRCDAQVRRIIIAHHAAITLLLCAWRRDCTLNPDRNMARCSAPEEPFGPGSSEYDESEVPFRYGVDTLFLVFQHLALRELCTVHCVSKVPKTLPPPFPSSRPRHIHGSRAFNSRACEVTSH